MNPPVLYQLEKNPNIPRLSQNPENADNISLPDGLLSYSAQAWHSDSFLHLHGD